MERERGAARINNGAGAIDTENPPQPVMFAPSSFPGIVDGQDVYFKRVSPGSEWAAEVVPASGVDSLLRLAGASSGFTRDARSLVLRSASKFVAEAQAAPTPAHARKHLALAKERMSAVAALASSEGVRVGVAAVRKALA